MKDLILRLLRKDETSPSGYRIVGYEHHVDGGIYHSLTFKDLLLGNESNILIINDFNRCPAPYKHLNSYIEHDAFELGIKVGDEWIFSCDLVDYGDGIARGVNLYITELGDLEKAKKIGTIHDPEAE